VARLTGQRVSQNDKREALLLCLSDTKSNETKTGVAV